MTIETIVSKYRFSTLSGRYVIAEDLAAFYKTLDKSFKLVVEGMSVENREVISVEVGMGATRVYMWSQMHGNESTTTKAVIDLLTFLNSDEAEAQVLKDSFTFMILPMLNPDGAAHYTRVNANEVDLNRDSIALSQPESRILRSVFERFKPDYAFNLHDQRTIFGVGDQEKPATLSFLAPSYDEARSVNETRQEAMKLIVGMNADLQELIPGQIGRFDDGFNINCIGDYFQSCGVPTILFEAGHYPRDYEREVTRGFVFRALLVVLKELRVKNYLQYDLKAYFDLPENAKSFQDIVLKKVWNEAEKRFQVVTLQYFEELMEKKISFTPIITDVDEKECTFAHLAIGESLRFKEFSGEIATLIGKKAVDCIDFGQVSVNDLLNK